MQGRPYFPTREAEFVDWSQNLITVSEAHAAAWNLPAPKLQELRLLHDEFSQLHVLCNTAAYTRVDMENKNEKKASLIHLEEVFVRNNLQNNDVMTDAGREEAQIPKHDKNPTPHGAPDGIPDIEVQTPLPRTLRLRFRAMNAPRWGKPENVHGLECLWGQLDAPPAHVEDLLHSAFTTSTPLDLVFDEDARGKRVYFTVRWEGGSGKKGSWSEVFTAVVP
ncbi:hypothetical protein FACS189461_3310 [Spirochaetia bacterium]|nr:hypothetical protein FACS189461_3310 [Spirochaetia bacterium]